MQNLSHISNTKKFAKPLDNPKQLRNLLLQDAAWHARVSAPMGGGNGAYIRTISSSSGSSGGNSSGGGTTTTTTTTTTTATTTTTSTSGSSGSSVRDPLDILLELEKGSGVCAERRGERAASLLVRRRREVP